MTANQLSLRPLGVGEILDRAVRLYRRHFLTFIAIIAVVQVPMVLAQLGLNLVTAQTMADPSQISTEMVLAGSFGGLALSVLSFIFVQSLGTAALTSAISDSYLGRPVSLGASYRKIGRVWLVVAGALLLLALLSLGLSLWWILVPCVGWFTGLGMLLYLGLVISPLIAPVIVVERERAGASLRRAWDLSRRRFWPVVGFVTALFVLTIIFTFIPILLAQFLLSFGIVPLSGSFVQQQVISTAIGSLTGLVLGLIFVPFQLTAMTLLYFDLRIRTEGFDLAVLAENLGQAQASPAPAAETPATEPAAETLAAEPAAETAAIEPAGEMQAVEPAAETDLSQWTAQTPSAAKTPLVTRRELGYFVVLTIIPAAAYFVLILGIGMLAAISTGGL